VTHNSRRSRTAISLVFALMMANGSSTTIRAQGQASAMDEVSRPLSATVAPRDSDLTGLSSATDRPPMRGILRAESLKLPSMILERADRNIAARGPTSPGSVRPQRSAVRWGILGGVIVGVAVAGVAADRYGNNETGHFCTPCFALGAAIAMPVGAGLGALAGYLIDIARR
jgi:hypothetical protein